MLKNFCPRLPLIRPTRQTSGRGRDNVPAPPVGGQTHPLETERERNIFNVFIGFII